MQRDRYPGPEGGNYCHPLLLWDALHSWVTMCATNNCQTLWFSLQVHKCVAMSELSIPRGWIKQMGSKCKISFCIISRLVHPSLAHHLPSTQAFQPSTTLQLSMKRRSLMPLKDTTGFLQQHCCMLIASLWHSTRNSWWTVYTALQKVWKRPRKVRFWTISHFQAGKSYLERKQSAGIMSVMEWPPQSPDLNPIELLGTGPWCP